MPNVGDCLPGDQNVAGLCYTVPAGWAVTAPGFIGQKCDQTRFATGDSWDPTTYTDKTTDSTDAKTANAATRNFAFRDDGTSCWIDVDTVGRGTGYAAGCPSGTYKDGALCYTNCPSGWKGVAGVCWPDNPSCPPGTTDSGVSCTKNSFMQNIVGSSTSCPNGWRNDGTSCWEDVSCSTKWNDCSWKTLWGSCVGGLETSCSGCGCIKQGVNRSCPSGYSLSGLLCYQNCPSGYTSVAGVCWPQCGDTSKWSDTGVACAKKSSVPAPVGGVVPSICGQTNGYNDDLALGVCYPNCVGFAQKSGKPFWKNYHGTTVNFCQRDAKTQSKNVKSSIGQLPYPSAYYPTSNIANMSFITVDNLADTGINNIYTTSGSGCLPNIDADKLAPGTLGTALDVATKNGFASKFPANGEFTFAMGNQCDLCPTAYGKECAGSTIKGVQPGVKRTKYMADPLDCCNTGAKKSSDGTTTCDPKYWSSAANRISDCYAATAANGTSIDDICNDPTQYSANAFCTQNYKQIPVASKTLTDWTDWTKCPVDCGGGIQSQTRVCNVTQSGSNLHASRNTDLSQPGVAYGTMTNMYGYNPVGHMKNSNVDRATAQKKRGFNTDGSTSSANSANSSANSSASSSTNTDYFIVRDDCAGQPLTNTQVCNTQNCVEYAVENYRSVQFILLIIVVYILYYFMGGKQSNTTLPPAYEPNSTSVPFDTAPSAPPT